MNNDKQLTINFSKIWRFVLKYIPSVLVTMIFIGIGWGAIAASIEGFQDETYSGNLSHFLMSVGILLTFFYGMFFKTFWYMEE